MREMNTITTWEQINNLLCLHFPNGVSILSLQYRMFRSRRINETGSTYDIHIFQVQKVIESLTSKTIEETVKELMMENSFLKNEQIH